MLALHNLLNRWSLATALRWSWLVMTTVMGEWTFGAHLLACIH
jgi:hypothetical protein